MSLRTVLLAWAVFLTACQPDRYLSFTREIVLISQEAEIKLLGNNPDPAGLLDTLATLSRTLATRISPADSPRVVISTINHFLFNEWGLIPEPDTSSVENVSLFSILRAKKASCLGLVCLYLAVTEELALPLYGVLLPGHLFLRYQDDSATINIETLKQGIARTDSFYRDHFRVPARDAYYLNNLDRRQVTGALLYNLGNECRKRERYEDAIAYYQRAVAVFPGLAEAWDNLGKARSLLGRQAAGEKAWQRARALQPKTGEPSIHKN